MLRRAGVVAPRRRVFTGKVARERPQANRAGMQATLARLKQELEAG